MKKCSVRRLEFLVEFGGGEFEVVFDYLGCSRIDGTKGHIIYMGQFFSLNSSTNTF